MFRKSPIWCRSNLAYSTYKFSEDLKGAPDPRWQELKFRKSPIWCRSNLEFSTYRFFEDPGRRPRPPLAGAEVPQVSDLV